MEKDFTKIDLILEDYWKGESSLEQEQILQDYFSGEVEEKHRALLPMFSYFSVQQSITLRPDVDLPTPHKQSQEAIKETKVVPLWKRYRSIAAVALVTIAAGAFLLTRPGAVDEPQFLAMEDTYEDPEEAYAEVVEALQFISSKMNDGLETTSSSLEKIKALNEQFSN